MRGLGTIINALAIVIGGVLGILFKRFLKERYQDTIIKATDRKSTRLNSSHDRQSRMPSSA